MPKLHTLQETWDGQYQNAGSWVGQFNITQITYANGQLNIALPSGSALYHGFDSAPDSSLVDSSYTTRVIDAGNQSLVSVECYPVQLVKDSSNTIYFLISGGTVYAVKKVANASTNIATVTYDSTVHIWFRIREQNNVVYWETSRDGITWTQFASETVANLFAITLLRMEAVAGTWQAETSSTQCIYDNFNYIPTNKPGNILPNVRVGNGMGRAG